ncbi:MAG: LysM peptidoglycan-binding domain-containing protein [Coriobacteriia bacterium]|nr:LysM peptidoglycan-binding domain-containing protein [Coriobacteriia bacterium]
MRFTALEIFLLVLFVITIIAAAVGPSLVRDRVVPDETVTIKVSEDETLWEIARAHPIVGMTTGETIGAIYELNDMTGSYIVAGQLLVVPADPAFGTAMARR